MRIGVISREFPPFFGGGIGSYTRRWAGALRDAGHEPTVITVGGDGVRENDRLDGIPVARLPFLAGDDWSAGPHPMIRNPRNLAAFSQFWGGAVFAMSVEAALPEIVRERGLEVLEAPDTGALAWFALNRRRTDPGYRIPPVMMVVHSPSAWVDRLNRAGPGGRPERELAAMELDSARMADALICPSNDLARQAERLWGLEPGRIAVVPNPLGELEPEFDPRPGEPGRIACFGRVEYRKGIDTLLASFALLATNTPDATLDVVGEDTSDPESGESLSSRLAGRFLAGSPAARVRFHGKIDPGRVRDFMRSARVVVVPSPDDNFPYTCVEAMASGRVVVAARAGGMRDMIRDGLDGFLFTPSDPSDLVRALERALNLDEPRCRELGRAAAERIASLCGNRAVVERRLAIARGLLSVRPAPFMAPGPYRILGRASTATRAALDAAMANPSLDFAYPWTRARSSIACYGPATIDSLRGSRIPAIAVRESALEGIPNAIFSDLAARLVEAGRSGAPLPHAIEPIGILSRVLGRRQTNAGYAPA